jgi:hypothetical protein
VQFTFFYYICKKLNSLERSAAKFITYSLRHNTGDEVGRSTKWKTIVTVAFKIVVAIMRDPRLLLLKCRPSLVSVYIIWTKCFNSMTKDATDVSERTLKMFCAYAKAPEIRKMYVAGVASNDRTNVYIKFNQNPSSGSRIETCGLTGGQTLSYQCAFSLCISCRECMKRTACSRKTVHYIVKTSLLFYRMFRKPLVLMRQAVCYAELQWPFSWCPVYLLHSSLVV